jgi:hypothetical protein
MGLGQNGHDFSNGLVHIHGGTVTLPREVCMCSGIIREDNVLTMAGLGAHMRQTTASRKVARRAEELD